MKASASPQIGRLRAFALLLGGSLALLGLVVLSFAVVQSQHRAREDAIGRFADRGELAAQLLAGSIEQSSTRQGADAQLRLAGTASEAALKAWEGESDSAIPYTALYDGRGRLLAVHPSSARPASSTSGRAALRVATGGRPATSGVTSSSEGPVIETFVPFPAGSEGLRVLVVALPVELFAQFASGALKDAAGTPTGSAYVTDQAGTPVTAVGPSAELGDRAARVSEAIRDGRAGGRLAEQRLVVRPVSGTGLVVALTAPEGELTVDLPSTVPPRIALGGLALALLAVFLLTARSLREARRLDAARHAAEQAGHAADRANLAKSEFLSRMSHELRTPLNAILGFGQLLEMEEHVSPEQRESMEQIIKGGRRLLELINEVLDISRIESGMLRLSLEPVAIEEVVQDAGELIRPLADGRGIRLRTELPPDILDGYVTADRQRLGQVLLNLLSNALKYNVDQGTVSVIAAKGRDRVRIGVTDTGPGIPQDKISLLFTPFERLGAEQTNVEGTGLGLTLSKNLVEAMGGTLEVDTMAGAGTTFWVELQSTAPPSPQTHAPPAQVVHRPVETRGKVLYIEDNLSNLRLIERLMRHRADLELIPAMTGALGIELAQQHTPDVVFLDLHLSDLPGDEVLGRLRNDPRTGTIPVVILSADATPGQIE